MTEPRYLKTFDAVDTAVFLDEAGRTANLHFLAVDNTPLVVTVPRRTLEMPQGHIEQGLADAPNPFGPESDD